MPGAVGAFAFVYGLILGSFNTALVARVPNAQSMGGRSQCPSCGTTIRLRHLIPLVSWVLLKGRCSQCKAHIPASYPLIELATAIVVVLTAYQAERLTQALAWVLVASFGVALAIIDWRTYRLPNGLVLASLFAALALLAVDSIAVSSWAAYGRAALAGLGLAVFFFLLRILSRGGMGMGDVKLAGVLGFVLGYEGWAFVYVGAFLGFLLGAIYGVGLMLLSGAGRKTKVPYGPFMLAGAWLSLWATPWVESLLFPWR